LPVANGIANEILLVAACKGGCNCDIFSVVSGIVTEIFAVASGIAMV
jgi:hypothetical protein